MGRYLCLFLLLIGLIFMAGCNLPMPCTATNTGAPGNLAPSADAVVPLTPSLTWEYPSIIPSPYPYPSGSADCALLGYQVRIVASLSPYAPDLGGIVNSETFSFSPAAPLMPATRYFWEVRAFSDTGTTGVLGPWSGYRTFMTGPVCETDSLVAPILETPFDGATIADTWPTLHWNYPDACLPEGYRIDLSTEASFSDTSLSGGTGNPQTRWAPGSELTDCTTYHWRVAAINGTTLGPFSLARSFQIQVGTCSLVSIIPSLEIPIPIPTLPTLDLEPRFIAEKNGNCRYGPSQVYDPPVNTIFLGESFPVIGKNEEETWVLLALKGDECWVSLPVGEFIGDMSEVPVNTDYPAPPPEPGQPPATFACHDYKDSAACKRDINQVGNCVWDPNKNVCNP